GPEARPPFRSSVASRPFDPQRLDGLLAWPSARRRQYARRLLATFVLRAADFRRKERFTVPIAHCRLTDRSLPTATAVVNEHVTLQAIALRVCVKEKEP